jgi:multimeric flavodoxin WrbA
MKTLILNGSPRKNGDTASLLRLLTGQLEGEVRVVDTFRSGISGCIDCRYCREHPGCAIKDGMQELYPYIEGCDNILIASPVYFSEVTPPVLSLGSRLQAYYSARKFRKEPVSIRPKRGAVLLVGGGDGRPDRAYETARLLLRCMGAKEILPMMGSFSTDDIPAVEDAEAVRQVGEIAAVFNRLQG